MTATNFTLRTFTTTFQNECYIHFEAYHDEFKGYGSTPSCMSWWQAVENVIKPTMNAEQLGGFFDGDGTIYISGREFGVGLTQCSYDTLHKIQKVYGGIIRKRNPRTEHERRQNHRHQYTLLFRGSQVAGILPFIAPYLVIKADKAEIMLKILDLFQQRSEEAKAQRADLVQEFNLVKQNTPKPRIERITWDYISGLFQAEGCLRKDRLSITQRNCPEVLHAIKAFMEEDLQMPLGRVDHERFVTWRTMEIRMIVARLMEYGLFHDEKLFQIHAFQKNDVPELTRLKHVDDDTPLETICIGNTRGLQLGRDLRCLWRNDREISV